MWARLCVLTGPERAASPPARAGKILGARVCRIPA